MGKYRTLGNFFDRIFRNDLNNNFEDIDADLKRLGAGSEEALRAADEADTQAIYANDRGDYADEKGTYAAEQGDYANIKGNYADEKAILANNAATNANLESSNLGEMKTAVIDATLQANEKITYITEKQPLIEQSIIDATEAKNTAESVETQFNQIITETGDSIPEITQARGGEVNLNARLEKTAAQLADKAKQADLTETNMAVALKAEKSEVNSLASEKANIVYVDTLVQSVTSGSPKGTYATISELTNAFPAGNENIYVVSSDGNWYYWNSTVWVSGGVYQAVELGDRKVNVENTTFIDKGRNHFNVETITVGKTINTTTGAITDNVATVISDFIPVKQQTIYARKNLCSVIRYDANKNFISGVVNGTTTVNTGVALLVRLVMPLSQVYGQQFQEGEIIIDDAFGLRIIDNASNAIDISNVVRTKYLKKFNNDLYTSRNLIDSATSFSAANAVVTDDYAHAWRTEEKAIKIATTGLASTGYIQGNYSTPLTDIGIGEILVAVYIPDITFINSVQLQMHMTDGVTWSGSKAKSELTTGWNILRFVATQSTYGAWTNFDYFRFYLYVSGEATAYIGKISTVMQNKAKVLIVDDHGYSNFKNVAYPQLKALGIPVTWAINPGRLGGTGGILTEAEIDELANDPYSEINFHAWSPIEQATQFMTPDELRTDTLKCMRWIQKRGYQPSHWWRSVFVQNLAENHTAIQDMVEAYSTPTGSAGYELYPFINKWNVGRVSLHGRDNAWFDTTFDVLKKTKPLLVLYTHDIHETDPIDLPEGQFNYFISKLTTAVSEGWIEGVTYSELKTEYSRVFNVDDIADYIDTLE